MKRLVAGAAIAAATVGIDAAQKRLARRRAAVRHATSEESERSDAPVTDDDLARLGTIARRRDHDLTTQDPHRAGLLLLACLAQGAAAHRVTGHGGVEDFDVWLFYADDPTAAPVHPRARATADLGPSAHGRRPADPARYRGRRVDLLARSITVPRAAGAPYVRPVDLDWPARVAAVQTSVVTGPGASTGHLRSAPMVVVWPPEHRGEIVHRP